MSRYELVVLKLLVMIYNAVRKTGSEELSICSAGGITYMRDGLKREL